MIYVFVTLCLFGGAFLETKALESCQQFRGVENFNLTGIVGNWYLVQQTKPDLSYRKCPAARFMPRGNHVMRRSFTNGYHWDMKPLMNDTKPIPSKFQQKSWDLNSNITVISTDYQSYLILYNCPDRSEPEIEIWSRKHEPFTSDLNKTINDVLRNNSLQHINLLPENLNDCNSLAMIQKLKKLSLKDETAKSCNNLAKGVQDFNKTRFLGHWYMVQTARTYVDDSECLSYHCSFYENGELVLANQRYDLLTTGLADQDKSNPAKFHSVMEIDVNVIMTILATDYQSYAIIYKCSDNLEDGIYIMAKKYDEPFTSDVNKTITDALTENFGPINLSPVDLSYCGKLQLIEQASYLTLGLSYPVECKIHADDIQAYDASRFNGDWYEVQYNIPSDRESCVRPEAFRMDKNGTVIKTPNASSSPNELTEVRKYLEGLRWVILSTDYETYSILCHKYYTKTLTRNYTALSGEFYKTVADKLEGNEMEITRLYSIDYQAECE